MVHRRPQIVGYARLLRAAGFTLIELLVVVAIIALLLSILLPSLYRARTQAKTGACLGNLHDFGIAMSTYASDNASYYPPTPYWGSTLHVKDPMGDDNLFVLWWKKYARNINSFTCPGTQHRVRAPEVKVQRTSFGCGINYTLWTRVNGTLVRRNDFECLAQYIENDNYGTSYEYNAWATDPKRTQPTRVDWLSSQMAFDFADPAWFLKTDRLARPLPYVRIRMHDADDGDIDDQGRPAKQSQMGIAGAAGGAHNNMPEPWDNHGKFAMNVLFDDGHVQSARASQVVGIWTRNGRTGD